MSVLFLFIVLMILSFAAFLYFLGKYLEDESAAEKLLEENSWLWITASPAAFTILFLYNVLSAIYYVFEWTLLSIIQLFTSKERS